jgi:predicted metal-dependent hydrolase
VTATPAVPVTHAAPPPAPHPPASSPTLRLFRHPRANRELALGEHRVAYELKRARRRSIGFVVSTEGLVVSAPRWVGQGDIDTALRGKGAWIVRKLQEQAQRLDKLAAAKVVWAHGAELRYLGQPLLLQLDPGVAGVLLEAASAEAEAQLPGLPPKARQLRVGLGAGADASQIRDLVQSWLQRQALELFKQRCQHYAPRLGVTVKRLALSNATTRWGSATSQGHIRLNWRLIHHALPTIDYVVVHELAHLREMNHSPAFWDVVRSVIPDLDQHRGTLKDETLPLLD